MVKYIVNGEERTVREFHLFGLTICIYRKVKHGDRRIKVERDEFFGTGTKIYLYLRH